MKDLNLTMNLFNWKTTRTSSIILPVIKLLVTRTYCFSFINFMFKYSLFHVEVLDLKNERSIVFFVVLFKVLLSMLVSLCRFRVSSPYYTHWRWQQHHFLACKLQCQDHAFLHHKGLQMWALRFLVASPRWDHGINLQVHVMLHQCNPSSGDLHHCLQNLSKLVQRQCPSLVNKVQFQDCRLIWKVNVHFLWCLLAPLPVIIMFVFTYMSQCCLTTVYDKCYNSTNYK